MIEEPDEYDYSDDESCEAIGSCDECECDIYEADCYVMDDGLRLCGYCAWVAMGCPLPNDSERNHE